jgi:DNA-binding NtrC family response regulator
MKPDDKIDVLIVDDELSVRKVLYQSLIRADFQCITAECGGDALAMLSKKSGCCDLRYPYARD